MANYNGNSNAPAIIGLSIFLIAFIVLAIGGIGESLDRKAKVIAEKEATIRAEQDREASLRSEREAITRAEREKQERKRVQREQYMGLVRQEQERRREQVELEQKQEEMRKLWEDRMRWSKFEADIRSAGGVSTQPVPVRIVP